MCTDNLCLGTGRYTIANMIVNNNFNLTFQTEKKYLSNLPI